MKSNFKMLLFVMAAIIAATLVGGVFISGSGSGPINFKTSKVNCEFIISNPFFKDMEIRQDSGGCTKSEGRCILNPLLSLPISKDEGTLKVEYGGVTKTKKIQAKEGESVQVSVSICGEDFSSVSANLLNDKGAVISSATHGV